MIQKNFHNERIQLFGVEIDSVDMNQAVQRVFSWIHDPTERCQYVVTPNLDHSVMLQDHDEFLQAYEDADLVVADGWPVVLASRLFRCPLPERVCGADMTIEILKAAADEMPAGRKLRVFLLGAGPGVAERAAEKIEQEWSSVEVVGCYSPPFGFEEDPAETEKILGLINEVEVDLLVVGLGAPKQELWTHANRHRIGATAALCVGATIDFLAGEKKRAPRWMQDNGFEWLHRVISEPRRLTRRYAHDAWIFPHLLWRQWRSQAAGEIAQRK